MNLFKKTKKIDVVKSEIKTEILSKSLIKYTKIFLALSVPIYLTAAVLYFTSEPTGMNMFEGIFCSIMAVFWGMEFISVNKKDKYSNA